MTISHQHELTYVNIPAKDTGAWNEVFAALEYTCRTAPVRCLKSIRPRRKILSDFGIGRQ